MVVRAELSQLEQDVLAAERLRSLYIQYRHNVGIFSERVPKPIQRLSPKRTFVTRQFDGKGEPVRGDISSAILEDSGWLFTAKRLRQYDLEPEMYLMWAVRFVQFDAVYLNMLKNASWMKDASDYLNERYFPTYEEVEDDFLAKVEKNGDLLGFEQPFKPKHLSKAADYTLGVDGSQLSSVFVYCVSDKYKLGLTGYHHPVRTMTAVREFCLHRRLYLDSWGDNLASSLVTMTDSLIDSTKGW